MDIGCIIAKGRNQNLVNEFDHLAGRLIQTGDVFFDLIFLFKSNIGDDIIQVFVISRYRGFSPGVKKKGDIFINILFESTLKMIF